MREASVMNPNDPEILNNLGVLLANAGKASEAKLAFEAALQVDSNYNQARDNLNLLKESQEQ